MVQATATLQERISRLDRKLTAGQIEELASLVRVLGFKLTTIKADKVRELRNAGVRPAEIARQVGISRTSVYRVLG